MGETDRSPDVDKPRVVGAGMAKPLRRVTDPARVVRKGFPQEKASEQDLKIQDECRKECVLQAERTAYAKAQR